MAHTTNMMGFGAARFRQLIEQTAQTQGVDPAMMMALLRQENAGGNPGAMGKAGEVGLFQIMPKTAIMYVPQLAQGNTPAEKYASLTQALKDPATNAMVAGMILARYEKMWPGAPDKVFAAYNGGPTGLANAEKNAAQRGTSWQQEMPQVGRYVASATQHLAAEQGGGRQVAQAPAPGGVLPSPAAPRVAGAAPGPGSRTTLPATVPTPTPPPTPMSPARPREVMPPSAGLPGLEGEFSGGARFVQATPEEKALGLDTPEPQMTGPRDAAMEVVARGGVPSSIAPKFSVNRPPALLPLGEAITGQGAPAPPSRPTMPPSAHLPGLDLEFPPVRPLPTRPPSTPRPPQQMPPSAHLPGLEGEFGQVGPPQPTPPAVSIGAGGGGGGGGRDATLPGTPLPSLGAVPPEVKLPGLPPPPERGLDDVLNQLSTDELQDLLEYLSQQDAERGLVPMAPPAAAAPPGFDRPYFHMGGMPAIMPPRFSSFGEGNQWVWEGGR